MKVAKDRPVKLQWLRTGVQKYGSQEEILPITEAIFLRDIRPTLINNWRPTYETWKAAYPYVTHVLYVRNPVSGALTIMDAGRFASLMPDRSERRVIVVDSWDEPSARNWARRTRVPTKQDWSSREDA